MSQIFEEPPGTDDLVGRGSFLRELLATCAVYLPPTAIPSDPRAQRSVRCAHSARAAPALESALRVQSQRQDEFIRDLREYMSCTSNLAVLLAPTTTQAAPSTAPTLGRTEDTLLHIILRAKCIQSAVIESVIDRMLALCDGAAADLNPPYERGSNRDPVESSGNCGDDEKKALSVLCFNHLRWCDNIQDPEYLLASLLEALQVMSLPLQVEVIGGLPGLAPDRIHESLVDSLTQLAQMTSELVPSVLEAISNLGLLPGSAAHREVLEFAADALSTAPSAHLPAVTRFLLESADTDTARAILLQVRGKIGDYLEATCNSNRPEDSSCHTLLLSIFKSCFQSCSVLLPTLCDILLTGNSPNRSSVVGSRDAQELPRCVEPVDLWIMFSLAGYHNLRTQILAVLCRKYTDGTFSDAVLGSALTGFQVTMEGAFPSILSLAQSGLAANKSASQGGFGRNSFGTSTARALGGMIYAHLYEAFPSVMHRQDVVASLVGHAGSPNPPEVDSALSVLQKISKRELEEVLDSRTGGVNGRVVLFSFSPFIKSLLDDLSCYSESQIRVIFRLLFQSCLCDGSRVRVGNDSCSSSRPNSEDGLLFLPPPQDDLSILLRKMGTSADPHTKKAAIIGSVSFLSQFRWLDKWQFCFGNPALLSVRSDGGHTFLSEDIAVQLCQPYVEHLHVLMKSFADHSWQYSCLINELSIALRDGCLGLVSAADRDSSYATQSYLLARVVDAVEDVLFKFISFETKPAELLLQPIIPTTLLFNINGSDHTCVKLLEGALLSYWKRKLVHGDRVLTNLLDTQQQSLQNSDALSILIQDKKMGLADTLPAILGLACACRKALSGGDPMELGVLLGCPLSLPTMEVLNESDSYDLETRFMLCDAMLLAVGWLRGVINIFGDNADEQNSHQLIRRVNQLVDAEEILVVLVQRCPEFLCWRAPDISLLYYNSRTGKKISHPIYTGRSCTGLTGTAPRDVSLESTGEAMNTTIGSSALPTIASIRSAIETLVQPLHAHAAILLGRNPCPEYAPTSVNELEGAERSDVGKRVILHRLHRQAVQRLTTLTADSICAMIGRIVTDPNEVVCYIRALDNASVFAALHGLLKRALLSLTRLHHNYDNTLNESTIHSIDMGGVSVIEGTISDDDTGFEDPNCEAFGSQFYCQDKSVANTGTAGGNGTVTSILRIIRTLLRVELMSDCSIGRALHILGSGVIPTVESDQYGGLVVVCDTLLGLAEALVDVGLVLDQILPILETTELALEAAEEGLFLIRCENHISRLKETAISLSCLCGRVLGHETSGFPLGSKQAGFILGVHLRRALEPTHRVKYFTTAIYDALGTCGAAESRRGNVSDKYKWLNSKTLPAVVGSLLRTLTLTFEAMNAGYDEKNSEVEQHELAESLHDVVKLFFKIVNVTKKPDSGLITHSVLCSVLKEGRAFLDAFLRNSKMLHSLFSTQRGVVLALLTALQKATRQLQTICGYGKQKRDKSLANEAPYLKRALETLIYNMKEMASDNKCLGALSVGVLKNRNLDGTEIFSHDEYDDVSEGGSIASADPVSSSGEDEVLEFETDQDVEDSRIEVIHIGKKQDVSPANITGKKRLRRVVDEKSSSDEDS